MSQYFKGIALPWGLTIPSVIDPKDDANVIKSSIIWIILTCPGERVMQPTFGSGILLLVHDPNDEIQAAEVKGAVKEGVERWDDRVTFVDFVAKRSPDGGLRCQVTYKYSESIFQDEILTTEFTINTNMLDVV